MFDIDGTLSRWQSSLCPNVSLGGCLAKNAVAYKWLALYRALVLRESIFWRVHDLLSQSQLLFRNDHILGSRILIRSAIESMAVLVYLNRMTDSVLNNELNFHEFDKKTRSLLLGSKDQSTKHESINILTILKHCEKNYKGISKIYSDLSEGTHPNFEGVCIGYSEIDYERHVTSFQNNWIDMWSDRHAKLMEIVCVAFEWEYNRWAANTEALESWVAENDTLLESSKDESV